MTTRRTYHAPQMSVSIVTTRCRLLAASNGMPTDNGDGTISWDIPSGSFGSDEEVASRRRHSIWCDDED